MWRNERGFLLLGSYYLLSVILLVITIGLTRAATEVNAASRFVAKTQAFHLADGGLDSALLDSMLRNTPVMTLLRGPDGLVGTSDDGRLSSLNGGDLNSSGTYSVIISDNQDEPVGVSNNPMTDTDGRIILTITGTAPKGMASYPVRVTMQLSTPGPMGAFDYLLSTTQLRLTSGAQLVIGDIANPLPLYMAGYLGCLSANTCDDPPQLYLSRIDHGNPSQAMSHPEDPWPNAHGHGVGFCPICTATSGAFPSGVPPIRNWPYDGSVPTISAMWVDLKPYYDKAIAQKAIDNKAYHHITTSTTLFGSDEPDCFRGIIYVEVGVDLTLANDVCIKGTIVHEGVRMFGSYPNNNWGKVQLVENNTRLFIDSLAPTGINAGGDNGTPFAPGVAIVGGAMLNFQAGTRLEDWKYNAGDPNAPGIKGFIMTGSGMYGPGGGMDYATSRIASTGLIAGGLIGVYGIPVLTVVTDEENEQSGTFPFDYGEPGPVLYGQMRAVPYGIGGDVGYGFGGHITMDGSARIRFVPLTQAPPGFEPGVWNGQTTQSPAPTVLLWDGG